jgi:hypothetical protein
MPDLHKTLTPQPAALIAALSTVRAITSLPREEIINKEGPPRSRIADGACARNGAERSSNVVSNRVIVLRPSSVAYASEDTA